MDTAQWPQGIGVVKQVEKKPRPSKEQALNCPRCSSTNTKFCYYNNYSLSQPRYFCKTCRRYWTEGGSLRNVPVGGGSRKNRRPSSNHSPSSSSSPIITKKITQDHHHHHHQSPQFFSPQNPKISNGHDLNLAYNPSSHYNGVSQLLGLPFGLDSKLNLINNPQNPCSNLSPFVSIDASLSSNSCFGNLGCDLKPSLGFSLDGGGLENGYGVVDQDHHHANNNNNNNIVHESSRSMLFPFEELKTTNDEQFVRQQQERGHLGADQSNGYWNGMPAGGSW